MINPIYNRETAIRSRLNDFMSVHLGLPEMDYYGNLKPESICALKSVLADINNLLTLKVSLSFVEWVTSRLSLDESTKHELVSATLAAKPNSNGFDILLGYPVAFVAEVKCNVPINGGAIYGSAQRNGIEKDILALLNGKIKSNLIPATSLKFMVFLDLPEIRSATEHFARSSITCGDKLLFVNEDTDLKRSDIVYVVYVKLEQQSILETNMIEDDVNEIIENFNSDREFLVSEAFLDGGIDPLFGRLGRAALNQLSEGEAALSRYGIWANTVRDNIRQADEELENGSIGEARRLLRRAANSLSAFAELQAKFESKREIAKSARKL